MKVLKKEANAILQSLRAGVTPRLGLRHIVVGRTQEIKALLSSFEMIRDGGATLRFIIGRYGSGKSFLLQVARLQAMEKKLVVAHADLTPVRRLQGSDGQALALYRELMNNLSTQASSDGNALPAIIEKWLENIQTEVLKTQNLDPQSTAFEHAVGMKALETLNAMQHMVSGFDFSLVIRAYYRGHLAGDGVLKDNALRWISGQFNNITQAKQALGVGSIVNDSNWYDCLKAFAQFATQAGYAGLLVCIDEAVNLYKITNAISRNNNYERLLSIVNDCLESSAGYIGFLFGGTPEFLEDQQRGLFSYEALRSRLAPSKYGQYNSSGPVLKLQQLSNEEIFVLLQKLRDLHGSHVPNSRPLEDQAIEAFMREELKRIGSTQLLTPRELIRDFVALSDLLAQQPERHWQELLGQIEPLPTDDLNDWPTELPPTDDSQPVPSDPLDRFTNLKL